MKEKTKCFLWVLIAHVIAIGFGLTGMGFAGYWLHSNDKPVHSDIIVVLAGGSLRAFYASDLYLKGYASKVYVSKAIRVKSLRMLDKLGVFVPVEDEIYRQVLLKKGVPEKAIHFFGKSSFTTLDEAEALKQYLDDCNKSLLIITSPYHVRRTRMIFKEVLTDSEIRVVGTPYESFSRKWWKDKESAKSVILEMTKILFYKMGGRFHSETHIFP